MKVFSRALIGRDFEIGTLDYEAARFIGPALDQLLQEEVNMLVHMI
ncbi:MAG: hypothetical protein ABSG02_19660 [Terriglobales bacterium]|jgi:hypothetical protein